MTRISITVLLGLSLLLGGCHKKEPVKQVQTDVFDTQIAMRIMFGNFDTVTKSSLSKVPAGASTSNTDFEGQDEIRVRPFFVQELNQDGVRKVYLLTWAKPAGQPFDCKGCAPLISAAVFTPGPDGWKIESVGRGVVAFGDFGKPPEASLLNIGPQERAFLLRVTSTQERTTTVEALLVPWSGTVEAAMQTVVSDSNEGNCGGAYPCFKNQRELKLVPGPDPKYNDIELTLSGTDMPHNPPYKKRSVSGVERLQFHDGKYVHVERQGDTISAEAER